MASRKYYYFLVAGQLVFTIGDSEEVNMLLLNAVVHNETNLFPARMLGEAQKALQMTLHTVMKDPTITIRDVVITNISQLGCMSREDFHALPKNVAPEPKNGLQIIQTDKVMPGLPSDPFKV